MTSSPAFSVVWGLAMGAVSIGSIAAPVAVEAVGPRAALVVVGMILPLLTLCDVPTARGDR